MKVIYDVSNSYKNIKISSEIIKEFYYKLVEYRYNNILYKTYTELCDEI